MIYSRVGYSPSVFHRPTVRPSEVQIIFLLFQLQHPNYARLYDLSRSEPKKIKELCVQVLLNGASLDFIENLLELANLQCAQGFKVRDVVKESLRAVLLMYRYVW